MTLTSRSLSLRAYLFSREIKIQFSSHSLYDFLYVSRFVYRHSHRFTLLFVAHIFLISINASVLKLDV